jgi:Rieske Fe-S protein
MSNEHPEGTQGVPRPPADRPQDDLPSVESIAGLDAYLDDLLAERRPSPRGADGDLAARQFAAQLRLAREGVEQPAPEFLDKLEQEVARAVAGGKPRERRWLSRGGFLRSMATLAGGAGLGVAGVEAVIVTGEVQRPHDLVAAGNERWYDVAAVDEVPEGGAKPFSAGGVLGYLLKDGGNLHAVSAICTHMGCRVKPNQAADGQGEFHCLCHASRFARSGAVKSGLAPSPLLPIKLQVKDGRVYALGTRETV